MKILLNKTDPAKIKTPLLLMPFFDGQTDWPEGFQFLKDKIGPSLSSLPEMTGFKGKLDQKQILFGEEKNIAVIALLGAGKRKKFDIETARILCGNAVKLANDINKNTFTFYWPSETVSSVGTDHWIPEMVAALETATFKTGEFLTEQEQPANQLEKVDLIFMDRKINKKQIDKGKILGNSVNYARRLADYPSNILNPKKFVTEIRQTAKKLNWELEVLDRKKLNEKGFDLLLSVSQGSANRPYMVVAQYRHPAAKRKLAFVGKGVTFDAGGISIKPSRRMEEMKYDMCGAAAVLGAMAAISRTKIPVHLIGGFPLVENMPSGKASRPGDIVKGYSGTTVEIINTDAEGRLILADALSYIEKKFRPDYMIDLATLTGSVEVALGKLAAGLLTRDTYLLETLQQAAERSGEMVWPLPLWEDYQELIKSKIADMRNVGTKPQAGTITAAIFLQKFVEKTPWAHLDIANTAYDMPEKSYRPAGASGFGVKLLWHWVNHMAGG